MNILFFILAWLCVAAVVVSVFGHLVHKSTKADDDEQWEYFNNRGKHK